MLLKSLLKRYKKTFTLFVLLLFIVGGPQKCDVGSSHNLTHFKEGSMQVDGVEYYGQVVGESNNDFKSAERPILGRKKSELGLFFPERADQPFVVDAEGVRVTLKAIGVNSAPIVVGDGEIRYNAAYTKTDSLHKVEKGRSEEFLYLRDETAPTSFEYELTAIEGADDVSLKSGAIIFSRSGSPKLQIEAPWVIDADGRRSDEAVRWELAPPSDDGSRHLRLNLDPAGLRYPLTVDPSWSVISSMTMASLAPRSVRLQNGKVLVALDNGTSSGVNLYDPSTATWSSTGSFVAGRRYQPTLTLLQNGKVLAAGGYNGSSAMTSAEIYDPSTGTWSLTGSLTQRRWDHQDTLLSDGKVLITAGYNYPFTGSGTDLEFIALVEIYDPATGTWSSRGNGRQGSYQKLTLLGNGKVLAVGGAGGVNNQIAQVYDPTANTWTDAGNTGVRMDPTATLLSNGKVLVAGGRISGSVGADSGLITAQLYDPVAGTWSNTGSLSNKRSSHTATLLSNGNVLVVGGENPVGTSLSTAEIYDSTAGTWSSAGSLTTARRFHAATLLVDSTVLFMGGTVGSAGLSSVERYGNPNQPPTITAAIGVSRTAGGASSNSTIATVTDPETAAGSLTVTVTSANPSNGVTISNIANTTGTITADIVAASGATNATFTLQVSDGTATATATLNVTVSAASPGNGQGNGDGITVSSSLDKIGPGGVVTITHNLTNSSSTPQSITYNASLPTGLNAIPGGCTPSTGSCAIGPATAPGGGLSSLRRKASFSSTLSGQTITWVGTIPGSGSVAIVFKVQVSLQAASGTQYCVTTTIGGSAGPSACVTVTAPPAGPGAVPEQTAPVSQQRPGSVLIYNLYTSGASGSSQDTRIVLTNTNLVNPVSVHLFMVDGSNCSVADLYLTLTQSQTMSILASDLDPGVTGYIIAVATDRDGCPTIHNDLIGNTQVKFESGHRTNLSALGIAGLVPGDPLCTPGSVTATLAFNGLQYNQLPRTLAIDNLPPPATGNSSMLIVNRIGGDLMVGAQTLGTIAGLLFDDTETAQSFVLAGGTCQLRGVLGNNLPRTAPRYTSVIPAGRSGWMKFWPTNDQAITGVMINHSADGFSGGHNLHALTTTSAATLTIPVFPAS